MDKMERIEYEATRNRLKKILGIPADSGLNNAELAGRVEDELTRLRKELAESREESARSRAGLEAAWNALDSEYSATRLECMRNIGDYLWP